MDNANETPVGTVPRIDYCVYLYRNSLDKKIFYIGNGTDIRPGQLSNRNTPTMEKIKEIHNNHGEIKIEILRDKLDKATAEKFEAVAIDVIGLENLTNIIHSPGGTKPYRRKSQRKARMEQNLEKMGADSIKGFLDPQDANITEPSILIRINQLYRYGMDADSLYDVTRGIWVIGGRKAGGRRDNAKYAFAVFKGLVLEVYKIKQWYLAGTEATFYKTRPDCNELFICDPPRWEFEGEIAESKIRDKYLGKSVKKCLSPNSQNPIQYVNC